MAVVEAAEVELEGWVEADGAIAAAGPRLRGEDTAAVEAIPDRRAPLAHKPLQDQVAAGPAEWFRTGTSEGVIRGDKDLKRHRGLNPGQRARPRTCRPRRRPGGLAVPGVETKGDFLIWRRVEAPGSGVGSLREPRVGSWGTEPKVARVAGSRAVNWVR